MKIKVYLKLSSNEEVPTQQKSLHHVCYAPPKIQISAFLSDPRGQNALAVPTLQELCSLAQTAEAVSAAEIPIWPPAPTASPEVDAPACRAVLQQTLSISGAIYTFPAT